MPVVIHDFEVEVQAEPPASGASANDTTAPLPSAQELEDILRRQAERCARVYAH